MKTNRLITSLITGVCALVMALCVATPAFAAAPGTDSGTIQVTGAEDGVTVNAYQILTANWHDGTLNNPAFSWDANVAAWLRANGYDSYANADNSVTGEFNSGVDTGAMATFYDKLAAAIRAGDSSVSVAASGTADASGNASLDVGSKMGNFLVLIEGGSYVYRASAVNLVPTYNEGTSQWELVTPVKVELKRSEPSISKKIVDNSDLLDEDNVAIGSTVKFRLEADVPTYPANATAKQFVISDNLSEGLTFDGASTLKVTTRDGSGAQIAELTEGNGFTVTTAEAKRPAGDTATAMDFRLDFTYASIAGASKVRVEYTATVNKDAVLGTTAGNPNDVYLDYSNNPYDASGWNSKDDDVTVYTFGLAVEKVDASNSATKLAGAKFELRSGGSPLSFVMESAGVYHVAKPGEGGATTKLETAGSGGLFTIKGLVDGTYALVETEAPAGGYVLDASEKTVVIGAGVEGYAAATGIVSKQITNSKGFALPQTGGIGTAVFTAGGVVLLGGGAFLLMTLKRRNSQNA